VWSMGGPSWTRLTKVRKFGHEGALEMFIAAPHEFGE
jgi:hypothetical protein